MRTAFAALLLLAMGSGCAARRPAVPAAPPSASAAAVLPKDATPLRGLTHETMHGALWMHTSAEFEVLSRTTFLAAEAALERALAGAGSAALEQPDGGAGKPPAVVVDIDETMLDNAPFQFQLALEGTDFCPPTWSRWVEAAQARAVPGALEFAQRAAELGVRIVYVTNRTREAEAATIENLRCVERTDAGCVGFPVEGEGDVLTAGEAPPEGGEAWTSDKTARRAYVARTHRILLLIGDDLRDFVAVPSSAQPAERVAIARQHQERWGERWFLLPNAMYGSWERPLRPAELPADPARADEAVLRAKRVPGFSDPVPDACRQP